MSDVDREALDRLKVELDRSADPDSIRWRMALVYRDTGEVAGRQAALDLFDKIRRRFDDNPNFHIDVGRTYAEGGRLSEARGEYVRAIEVDSTQVAARVLTARLFVEAALRRLDFSELDAPLRLLDEARAYAPEDQAAMFELSLCCQLARKTPGLDPLQLSLKGKDLAERLTRSTARDGNAWLLYGVHLVDLQEWDAAEVAFQRAIPLLPFEEQSDLLTLGYAGTPDQVRRFGRLESAERRDLVRDVWEAQDPTPLSTVNEHRLEYWRRMALAKFYFSDEKRRKLGWKTEPGEVFVRYGFPKSPVYELGSFSAQTGSGGDPGMRSGGLGRTLEFLPPRWHWGYEFGRNSFTITFEDPSLHGDFRANDDSRVLLGALQSNAPVILEEQYRGGIRTFFVSAASVRGAAGRTKQTVLTGIGPWNEGKSAWWKFGVVRVDVTDSGMKRIAQLERRVEAADVYEPVDGASMLVVSQELDLNPGRYSLTVWATDSRSGDEGTWSAPLYVPEYTTQTLEISGIDFGLTGAIDDRRKDRLGRSYIPNPMRWVGDDRTARVYYEVYNLEPDLDGNVHYQTRYTVLPRKYVLDYADYLKRSRKPQDDALRFGGLGQSVGRVTLSDDNYSDTLYPPEEARLRAGGRVQKGGSVFLTGLAEGEYALLVSVTDLQASKTVSTQVPFQISSNDEMRSRLDGD